MSKQPPEVYNGGTRCPKCNRLWRSCREVTEAGGRVFSVGIALYARCPCGGEFPASEIWRRIKLLDGAKE